MAHPSTRPLALALLLAQGLWGGLPAFGADDLATRQRVDEAQALQRKGRDDLASDVWRKLLILDPNQRDALVNLGLIEARAGHTDDAQALLARARRLAPPPRGLAQLEAALKSDVPPARASTPQPMGDNAHSRKAADSGEEPREHKHRRHHRKTEDAVAPTTATVTAASTAKAAPPAPARAPGAAMAPAAAAANPPAPVPPAKPPGLSSPDSAAAPGTPPASPSRPRPTKVLPFLPPPV